MIITRSLEKSIVRNKKTLAGLLLATAALAVVTMPSQVLARDPFGHAANQAAMEMWLRQQQNQGFVNGYNPYVSPYPYNTSIYGNSMYGNSIYASPYNNYMNVSPYYDSYYDTSRRRGIGGLLQSIF